MPDSKDQHQSPYLTPPTLPPQGDPLAGIYTLLAGIGTQISEVNGRVGPALQLSASTADSIKDMQTTQNQDMKDTAVFHTQMSSHIKDMENVKVTVKEHGVRILTIEDWIKAWKVRIGVVVAIFSFIGALIGFLLNYGGQIKDMMGW